MPTWFDEPGAIEQRFYGVFEGGGAKGVAHAGALQAMAERRCWFAGVAGASAGAMTAALVAAGLSPKEIERCSEAALGRICTKTWAGLRRLRSETGYFPAEGLRDWLEELLFRQVAGTREGETTGTASAGEGEEESVREPVTFGRLFAATGIELNIVAADLSLRSQIVFSHHDTPDCAVADAVVASSSIPYAFASGLLRVPEPDLDTKFSHHTIVDGGVWANFPLYVFEDPAFRRYYGREPETIESDRILGFLLDEEEGTIPPRGRGIEFVAPGEAVMAREWSAARNAGATPRERWPARLGAWLLSPFYLLGRLVEWKSGVDRGRWPMPRSHAVKHLVYSVDGLLAGIYPVLFGATALAVVVLGAWTVGESIVVGQLGAVRATDWTDPGEIAGRVGFLLVSAVALAVVILLPFVALLATVANQFLLPASRRILYGLAVTYVAGSGAPPWARMKANVVPLPIPRDVGTLAFELHSTQRKALIDGAREAAHARLNELLGPRQGSRTPA